ncbi:MAG: RhuM family protein [Candidatus Paceibacterota bacterium]
MPESVIVIYKSAEESTEIQVRLESDTIWLSQKQMADLFEKDTDTIGLHLKNIFQTGELDEKSTTEEYSVVQKEGSRKVKRSIKHYNLDAIISVGYRVNSVQGTQFRIWANKVLRDYLVKGYAVNQEVLEKKNEKLKQLQETVQIIRNSIRTKKLSNSETRGLLEIISDYSYALDILDQYDYQTLKIAGTTEEVKYRLSYEEAKEQIRKSGKVYGNSELFGREKDESFRSSIGAIYQTFDGKDLYPSVEEKAANLLYFVTKNHSFTDGNKRIAAFLFLYFLDKNGILYNANGEKRIADNALVALTLMIAVSEPKEKETMVNVVVNLISRKN